MPILPQIATSGDRLSQLLPGPGNNAPARVSDVNTVIDTVNDHEDRIDAIEGGTVDLVDVQVEDGTVGVPSIHFADDLDTGIYRIGANNAGFSANGAKVLDIATTGLAVTGTLSASTTVTAGTQLLVSGVTNQIRLGSVAGNDVIITSPAPAADRVLTIPDPGAAAEFVMSEGNSTINGAKTFGTGIALPDGLVSALSIRLGADGNNGIYGVSDTQMGFAVEGALVGGANASGLFTDVIAEQTNTVGVTVDGVLCKDGGVSANSMFAGFFPTAAGQDLSGAGAINVTSYYTAWTTTAADAGTMAAGTQIGQRKKIKLIVDGGDGTLTPTSLSGGTTITFNDAGDYVEMIWNGANWFVIENFGCTIA